jgi:hypothetical protein
MGRVGQGAIYPSKISVMKNPDFVAVGDDRQKSNGVAEMMKKINIMEVLPRVCHERGIKFLANLGTQGGSESPTCSTFYAQNKGLLHPVFPGMDGKKHGMFDYENEKVVEHATDWLLELAEYDVDGISIDYNRSPFGMSEQIITKLHRRLNEKLASKRKKLEINIRFPVDNPDFYSALLSLLENNMIDSLIPSNLFSIYPEMDLSEYAKLAEIYSKKMYACVDFFGLRYTEDWRFVTPEEMKKRCSTYLNAGSDGIFFYQSEMILSLLGQQRVVKMLKQRVSPLRKTPNWKFPSMTRAKY